MSCAAGLADRCPASGLWGAEIGGFGRLDTGGPDAELYVRYVQHGFLLPFAEFPRHRPPRAVALRSPRSPRCTGATPNSGTDCCRTSTPRCTSRATRACQSCGRWCWSFPRPQQRATSTCSTCSATRCSWRQSSIARRARAVYLPAGRWFDFWTDTEMTGPAWIDYDAPLDRLPLFVRGGHALPIAPGASTPRKPLPPRRRFTCTGLPTRPRWCPTARCANVSPSPARTACYRCPARIARSCCTRPLRSAA
jgi:hypothetical protein